MLYGIVRKMFGLSSSWLDLDGGRPTHHGLENYDKRHFKWEFDANLGDFFPKWVMIVLNRKNLIGTNMKDEAMNRALPWRIVLCFDTLFGEGDRTGEYSRE